MRIVKRLFSQLHRYVLWALVSAVFWAWIFTFVTDTTRERKVVLFSDTPAIADTAMAIALEKNLPDGIRMVQVHPFSYAAFDTGAPEAADLYVLSETELARYRDRLCPIGGTAAEENEAAYGYLLYDAKADRGIATTYLTYTVPGMPAENYYLCFNASSVHLSDWTGNGDNAAILLAERILSME